MKAQHLACLFLPFLLVRAAALPDRCIPLKASERSRLETYVRKKFKVPASLGIEIGEAKDQECGSFRKLEVRSSDPSKKFALTLYASPDLRFLTRDLLDTRIDPEVEQRKRHEEFEAGLTRGDFPTLGPPNAPVTIAVFSDFQCPYCARFAQMLRKDVLPREGSNVRVVFRQFPLAMHPWARPAAQASVCLAAQNNDFFWKVHDYLFENQRDLNPQNVTERIRSEASRLRGFNRASFDSCLNEPKTAQRIESEIAFGSKNGISGTPSIFVNGRRVSVSEPEQLLSVIRQARSEPKTVAESRR